MTDTYALTRDHTQDIEIHKTLDGRIFGIKNIRQKIEGTTVTFIADICGDGEAAKEYLRMYGGLVLDNFRQTTSDKK